MLDLGRVTYYNLDPAMAQRHSKVTRNSKVDAAASRAIAGEY